jgi:plastocyanin
MDDPPTKARTEARRRRTKSMKRRFAIFLAAALVAVVSVSGVTGCGGGAGGGAQEKVKEAKQKVEDKAQEAKQKAQEAKQNVEKQAQEAQQKVGKKAQEQATAAAQQRATRTVSIENFAFVPAQITVRAGTKVTWVNNDSVSHTVTANNGAFDSGTLQQGEKFSRTFTKAGKKFAYHCEIHPQMQGKVTVKPQSSS